MNQEVVDNQIRLVRETGVQPSCEYWMIDDNEVVRCGRRPTRPIVINGQTKDLCRQHSTNEKVKEIWQQDMIFRAAFKKIFHRA